MIFTNLFYLTCNPLVHKIISMNKDIVFVYDPICPFAQRVWLALLEKKVPFYKKRVSLLQKTQELKDIYNKSFARDPTQEGVVPVLMMGDKNIAESDIIVWLLAE